IKDQVNKELENQKANGIKSNLEAKVTLKYADDANGTIKKLKLLGEEVRFIFITSQFVISEQAGGIDDENIQYNAGNTTVQAVVTRAEGDKCPRCWHYTTDVGKVAEHAD
ncbi:isoleucine--tRNA ligase, partial [Salmonella enterica subsp. enterica serovar Enteritidis]